MKLRIIIGCCLIILTFVQKSKSEDHFAPCDDRPIVSQPCEDGQPDQKLKRFSFTLFSVCVPFIYSGCGGNENNHLTKEDCERVCNKDQGNQTVDGSSSVANGRCQDVVAWEADVRKNKRCQSIDNKKGAKGWSYDKSKQECVSMEFMKAACAKTRNKFVGKKECELECAPNANGVAARLGSFLSSDPRHRDRHHKRVHHRRQPHQWVQRHHQRRHRQRPHHWLQRHHRGQNLWRPHHDLHRRPHHFKGHGWKGHHGLHRRRQYNHRRPQRGHHQPQWHHGRHERPYHPRRLHSAQLHKRFHVRAHTSDWITSCSDYPVWIVDIFRHKWKLPHRHVKQSGFSYHKDKDECVPVNDIVKAPTLNKFYTKNECQNCKKLKAKLHHRRSTCEQAPAISPPRTCPVEEHNYKPGGLQRWAFFDGKCSPYVHNHCEVSKNAFTSKISCVKHCKAFHMHHKAFHKRHHADVPHPIAGSGSLQQHQHRPDRHKHFSPLHHFEGIYLYMPYNASFKAIYFYYLPHHFYSHRHGRLLHRLGHARSEFDEAERADNVEADVQDPQLDTDASTVGPQGRSAIDNKRLNHPSASLSIHPKCNNPPPTWGSCGEKSKPAWVFVDGICRRIAFVFCHRSVDLSKENLFKSDSACQAECSRSLIAQSSNKQLPPSSRPPPPRPPQTSPERPPWSPHAKCHAKPVKPIRCSSIGKKHARAELGEDNGEEKYYSKKRRDLHQRRKHGRHHGQVQHSGKVKHHHAQEKEQVNEDFDYPNGRSDLSEEESKEELNPKGRLSFNKPFGTIQFDYEEKGDSAESEIENPNSRFAFNKPFGTIEFDYPNGRSDIDEEESKEELNPKGRLSFNKPFGTIGFDYEEKGDSGEAEIENPNSRFAFNKPFGTVEFDYPNGRSDVDEDESEEAQNPQSRLSFNNPFGTVHFDEEGRNGLATSHEEDEETGDPVGRISFLNPFGTINFDDNDPSGRSSVSSEEVEGDQAQARSSTGSGESVEETDQQSRNSLDSSENGEDQVGRSDLDSTEAEAEAEAEEEEVGRGRNNFDSAEDEEPEARMNFDSEEEVHSPRVKRGVDDVLFSNEIDRIRDEERAEAEAVQADQSGESGEGGDLKEVETRDQSDEDDFNEPEADETRDEMGNDSSDEDDEDRFDETNSGHSRRKRETGRTKGYTFVNGDCVRVKLRKGECFDDQFNLFDSKEDCRKACRGSQ